MGFIDWADRDIKCAEMIYKFSIESNDNKYFDIDQEASYHCSQAAEKYLKGYLAWRWKNDGKNNKEILSDLKQLGHKNKKILEVCISEDGTFATLKGIIDKLEPYELLKYPDEAEKLILSSGLLTSTDSVKQAQALGNFVKNKISN